VLGCVWRAVGLGWWPASAVVCSVHVGGLHSVRLHLDLPAAHDNFKCFVSAGDHSVRAACSSEWRVSSCRRNTWVASRRSLWTNVVGDVFRDFGDGRSWFMRRWSCCTKAGASTVGSAGTRNSQGPARDRHRRALLRTTAVHPFRRCESRGGLVAGPRSTGCLRGT
jgi:hypothetical protein